MAFRRVDKKDDSHGFGAADKLPRSDRLPPAPLKHAPGAILFGAYGRYISTAAILRAGIGKR